MFKFNFKYVFMALVAGTMGLTVASCSDDDDNGTTNITDGGKTATNEVKFIVTADDVTKDLRGGAYMRVFTNLDDTTRRDVQVYGLTDSTVFSADGYTAVAFNHNTNIFAGFIYAKGAKSESEGGIKPGSATGRVHGIRTYSFSNGALSVVAGNTMDGYGNTGVYNNYSYAVQGSNPQVMLISANGTGKKQAVDFSDYLINGSAPQITGITDFDGKVAMALYYADRDSFFIGFANDTLKLSKTIFSTKAGKSRAGRKATVFSHIVKDTDGNLYGFSGTPASTSKIGAVRVNKGSTEFDSSYFFDLSTATNGYGIRKVFHITGDKFLVECYAASGYPNLGETGKFLVVDMSDKSYKEVTGLAGNYAQAYIGWGDSYNGKYYLPVSNGTGLFTNKATDLIPTVYAIDANTGVATVFMTLKSNEIIKGFTIATK